MADELMVHFYIDGGKTLYTTMKMSTYPKDGEMVLFQGGKKGKVVATQWVFVPNAATKVNIYLDTDMI